MRNCTLLILFVTLAGCRPTAQPREVDVPQPVVAPIPAKEAVADQQVPQRLKIACTPLTAGLMRRWADSFRAMRPEAEIEVTASDASGSCLGMLSGEEFAVCGESQGDCFDTFDSQSGVLSRPIVVAIDELTIIVHQANPIRELTVDQVAWIYSEQGKSWALSLQPEWYERFDVAEFVNSRANPPGPRQRKPRQEEDAVLDHPRIDDWRELGCYDAPGDGSIHAYGRERIEADSTFLEIRTVGYPIYLFSDGLTYPRHPRNDDAIAQVKDADAMVAAVAADPQAIGYVSHSRLKPGVRVVPVQGEVRADDIGRPQEIDPEPAPYPLELPVLERPIYLRIRPSFAEDHSPLEREFLEFILSRAGQSDVVREGFLPLSSYVAAQQQNGALRTP